MGGFIGKTMIFDSLPRILAQAAVVGKKEGEGPFGGYFDEILPDDLCGCDTWEQAETAMQLKAANTAIARANLTAGDIGALIGGDLLNQITASNFTARTLGSAFIGLYGACSTMVESLMVGGALIESGCRDNALCIASSHFCTAERLYRSPLELGTQRPPSAQWTVTGCGALVLHTTDAGVAVTHATIGSVVDYNITDSSHMGAAMAPAAATTIAAHFSDTRRTIDDYDLIISGDLGIIGREILLDLLKRMGINGINEKLRDCGADIFAENQDTHAGGSGCGCIASMLCGHYLPKIQRGELRRILAVGTGALLSTTSALQGESIPGIAHAVSLEAHP